MRVRRTLPDFSPTGDPHTSLVWRRSARIVFASWMAIATMTLALVGCSGGDDDADVDASLRTEPTEEATTTTERPTGGGGGGLVLGECPLTDDEVSAAVGSEVPADGDCRWFDGVITVEVVVQGGANVLDGKTFIASRGYAIKDLDRGDRAFLGTREVEAHAEVEVGNATMSIELSGLEGAERFEAIALALIDAALE